MQCHNRQFQCCQHLFRQALGRIGNLFSRAARPNVRKRAAFLPERPLPVFRACLFAPPRRCPERKLVARVSPAAEPRAFRVQRARRKRLSAPAYSASPMPGAKVCGAGFPRGGAEGFQSAKGAPQKIVRPCVLRFSDARSESLWRGFPPRRSQRPPNTRKASRAGENSCAGGSALFCGVRPQRSHLSQSESICEAKRARSLFVPPLLCSMTVSRRFPAASRRSKVLCARRAA